MTNSTIATTTIEQLLPISPAKFDIRVSSGNLLIWREDTGDCILDLPLSAEQIAQIKAAQSVN